MNPITRNSIIAVSMFSVVYIFNFIRPDAVLYSMVAFVVLLLLSAKYLFNTQLTRESIVSNSKFILLPFIFNVASLSYISYLYSSGSRLIMTLVSIVANFYLLVALRKIRNLGERAAIFYRNVIILLTFFSVFLASSMLFRLIGATSGTGYGSFARAALVLLEFGLTYFATYFLTWEKGRLEQKDRRYALITAFLVSQVAWISSMWQVNYPVIGVTEQSTLGGSPIGAIIVTLSYYFLWGMISHKLDGNLNRKVLTEYLLFTVVFFVILFVTAKWLPN